MNEAWIVNASPLILFARISRLDLIERLALGILIPDAVLEEVQAGREKDPTAATALEWADRYRIADAVVPADIEHWDLGSYVTDRHPPFVRRSETTTRPSR